jgi:predicted transcriptional regulator
MGNKIGAPTKFNESLESVAIALAEKGLIDRDIAEIIGISESALNEHKKRKPEFHESLKKAKAEHDVAIVEQALLKRAIGMTVKEIQVKTVNGQQIKTVIEKELPPDATSLALYLRNRNPEKWCREKQNIHHEVEQGPGLTIEEARLILSQDPFLADS